MEQGAAILDVLLQDLSRMQGVVTSAYAETLTVEHLATLPALRLPMALVSASLPQPVGSWTASTGPKRLWEMLITPAVALSLSAAASPMEVQQLTHGWMQRLQSRLETEAAWTSLVATVTPAGPPGMLRHALIGAVTRELLVQFVADA